MNWLARLKKIDTAAERDATETTKRVSVVFVAPGIAPMTKTRADLSEANAPFSSQPNRLENLRKPQIAVVSELVRLESGNLKKPAMPVAANDPLQVMRLVAPQPTVSSDAVLALVSVESAVRPDPDRWCWPHSSAMTGREIDTMVERTSLFNRRGLPALDAERLADKLVNRDREADERRLCLECAHLSGRAGALRCAQWQRAGLSAPGAAAGLAMQLQRCDGFKDQHPQGKSS